GHEGLDRSGSVHGRRALRRDRPLCLHPARRRSGVREGGSEGLRAPRRARGPGRRACGHGGRHHRVGRRVPRGVHLHRDGV
ncbi:MAG: putative ferredoxin, partial [uncultured Acidimicrobiales bacterium]